MRMQINQLLEYSSQLVFENGWSISISQLYCGHCQILIVPRWIAENEESGSKAIMAAPDDWSEMAMIKRGDMIKHFDGTDDELIALIVAVRLRKPEPSFAKIGQDIMKAVKS